MADLERVTQMLGQREPNRKYSAGMGVSLKSRDRVNKLGERKEQFYDWGVGYTRGGLCEGS